MLTRRSFTQSLFTTGTLVGAGLATALPARAEDRGVIDARINIALQTMYKQLPQTRGNRDTRQGYAGHARGRQGRADRRGCLRRGRSTDERPRPRLSGRRQRIFLRRGRLDRPASRRPDVQPCAHVHGRQRAPELPPGRRLGSRCRRRSDIPRRRARRPGQQHAYGETRSSGMSLVRTVSSPASAWKARNTPALSGQSAPHRRPHFSSWQKVSRGRPRSGRGSAPNRHHHSDNVIRAPQSPRGEVQQPSGRADRGRSAPPCPRRWKDPGTRNAGQFPCARKRLRTCQTH